MSKVNQKSRARLRLQRIPLLSVEQHPRSSGRPSEGDPPTYTQPMGNGGYMRYQPGNTEPPTYSQPLGGYGRSGDGN